MNLRVMDSCDGEIREVTFQLKGGLVLEVAHHVLSTEVVLRFLAPRDYVSHCDLEMEDHIEILFVSKLFDVYVGTLYYGSF
jgi:hypothetical protein